jgi:hypothetical protein
MGRPLWRDDGFVFFICCWPLPAQSFPGPSPLELATIFYCFRFQTSLFVASYDSQGHGGGIRPRLHTGSELLYLWRGLYSLGTDRIENSLFPMLLRRSVSLLSNGRGTDTQNTSYVIVTLLAAWRADCCLATSNNIQQLYCCVHVFNLEVRCLAIHVTVCWLFPAGVWIPEICYK